MEMPMSAPPTEPILVKRYARSRLYDAADQRYATVEQPRKGGTFIVQDTETGADITRVLLA
jgi:polyhydroxyalkanoate synthesis regulator protein